MDQRPNDSVVINYGAFRTINFEKLLKKLKVEKKSPTAVLFKKEEFKKAIICNNTLSWNNVEQYIIGKDNQKVKVPFEIGADILLKNSDPEKTGLKTKIGKLIRESRIKSGLSQQELAIISGTSRSYISRIKNDRSDIELATLRKIVEVGLGKNLEIKFK